MGYISMAVQYNTLPFMQVRQTWGAESMEGGNLYIQGQILPPLRQGSPRLTITV